MGKRRGVEARGECVAKAMPLVLSLPESSPLYKARRVTATTD